MMLPISHPRDISCLLLFSYQATERVEAAILKNCIFLVEKALKFGQEDHGEAMNENRASLSLRKVKKSNEDNEMEE